MIAAGVVGSLTCIKSSNTCLLIPGLSMGWQGKNSTQRPCCKSTKPITFTGIIEVPSITNFWRGPSEELSFIFSWNRRFADTNWGNFLNPEIPVFLVFILTLLFFSAEKSNKNTIIYPCRRLIVFLAPTPFLKRTIWTLILTLPKNSQKVNKIYTQQKALFQMQSCLEFFQFFF